MSLPTVLAKAKGYFADEGLDVEILDIKGGGSQAASAHLLAVHSHVRFDDEAERSFNDEQPIHRREILSADLQRIDLEREALPGRRRRQRTETGDKVGHLPELSLG